MPSAAGMIRSVHVQPDDPVGSLPDDPFHIVAVKRTAPDPPHEFSVLHRHLPDGPVQVAQRDVPPVTTLVRAIRIGGLQCQAAGEDGVPLPARHARELMESVGIGDLDLEGVADDDRHDLPVELLVHGGIT